MTEPTEPTAPTEPTEPSESADPPAAAADAELPDAATPADTSPSPPDRPPDVRPVIGRAFEVVIAASSGIRGVSLYVGLTAAALLGPLAIALLAVILDVGGLDAFLQLLLTPIGSISEGQFTALRTMQVGLVVAAPALGLLAIDGALLVAATLGAVALGRRLPLGRGLALARKVFWAGFGVAALTVLVRWLTDLTTAAVIDPRSASDDQTLAIVQFLAETIVSLPFVYATALVAIGGLGARAAVRESFRLVRRRWRLAILIAIVGVIVSLIQLFALLAGLDLLVRFGTALGLGLETGAGIGSFVGAGLVAFAAILALGSLAVTTGALIAAPQVVGYLALDGRTDGLDRVFPREDAADGFDQGLPSGRWLTRGMTAAIAIGLVLGLVALSSL